MRFERKLYQTKTLLARTFRIPYPPGSDQIVRRTELDPCASSVLA